MTVTITGGIGTALKPANEPIGLARKPLEKGLTVAQNMLKWGTGVLNIDGARIDLKEGETTHGSGRSQSNNPNTAYGDMGEKRIGVPNIKSTPGRWPANILFDEEAAAMLDEQSGTLKSGARSGKRNQPKTKNAYGNFELKAEKPTDGSSGGASRFFYVAKASKRERNAGMEGIPEREKKTLGDSVNPSEGRTASKSGAPAANHHPTVKPVKLMEYLIRLVTPPGGTVLDPFMGSGSTCVAAVKLGHKFIGIEMNKEYLDIAERRIFRETDADDQAELEGCS